MCAAKKISCKPYGTCIENRRGFQCKCARTQGMRFCTEVKILASKTRACEKRLHKCKNGGTCLNSDEVYYCQCPPVYEGENCEIKLKKCVDNWRCVHGKCYMKNGSKFCACDDALGKYCATLIPFIIKVRHSLIEKVSRLNHRKMYECVHFSGFIFSYNILTLINCSETSNQTWTNFNKFQMTYEINILLDKFKLSRSRTMQLRIIEVLHWCRTPQKQRGRRRRRTRCSFSARWLRCTEHITSFQRKRTSLKLSPTSHSI